MSTKIATNLFAEFLRGNGLIYPNQWNITDDNEKLIAGVKTRHYAMLFINAPGYESALKQIAQLMSGEEWNSDTLEEIAKIVRKAGFKIKDIN